MSSVFHRYYITMKLVVVSALLCAMLALITAADPPGWLTLEIFTRTNDILKNMYKIQHVYIESKTKTHNYRKNTKCVYRYKKVIYLY